MEFTYVLSYFVRPQGKFDPEDYAQYVQPVASFNSVEQFWHTYRHLKRPSGWFHLSSEYPDCFAFIESVGRFSENCLVVCLKIVVSLVIGKHNLYIYTFSTSNYITLPR